MTEFYKVTGEKMRRYQKIRNVLLDRDRDTGIAMYI